MDGPYRFPRQGKYSFPAFQPIWIFGSLKKQHLQEVGAHLYFLLSPVPLCILGLISGDFQVFQMWDTPLKKAATLLHGYLQEQSLFLLMSGEK